MLNGIALSPDGKRLWCTEFGRNALYRVDLEAPAPGVLVVADAERADIGHEDVEAAERGGRGFDERLQRRPVGDIDRGAVRLHAPVLECRDRVVHPRGAAGANPDVAALFHEQVGDRAADPARCAGHDRLLALQPEIHALLLFAVSHVCAL